MTMKLIELEKQFAYHSRGFATAEPVKQHYGGYDMNIKQWLLGALALCATGLSLAAVNINTASAEELKALPGVGPSKAAAIVAYREQNGRFKSVEELKNVKGIGEGIYNRLKDEATVAAAAPKKAVPARKQ